MWHGRGHFLVNAHLFLDSAFHADQADSELVFEQLTNCANAAVAEVINVIHYANALAQFQQVLDRGVKIIRIERALVEGTSIAVLEQLDVELQPAYAREVVLSRIEKHPVEKSCRGIECRRIARTQFAVNFDQRLLRGLDRVALQRLADHGAHVIALGEEQIHFDYARVEDLRNLIGSDFRVGFQHDLAGSRVYNVPGSPRAFEVRNINFDFADLRLLNFFQSRSIQLASRVRDLLARLRLDAVRQLHADQVGGLLTGRIDCPVELLVADHKPIHGVEAAENVLAGTQAQSAKEDRAQEFALPVNADV